VKFCVAMMFQNEAEWLLLHLPVITRANIDGLVGLDGGSQDGSAEVFASFGGQVFYRPFSFPMCDHENHLIDTAERAGYDAVLKMDPDELFFPEHISQMPDLLGRFKMLRFPTYNFVEDRKHYNPTGWYPDWHGRAWRLNCGIHYIKPIHSVPNWDSLGWKHCEREMNPDAVCDVVDCGHIHLYHYGDIKDRAKRALHYANADRWIRGEPMIDALPEGTVLRPPFCIPFTGPQPLDPDVIGAKAPVEVEYGY